MNQNNERITNETLYPGYKDGQILQHTDVNKMIDVLKTGVNANYDDIKKMENGEKVVSKAASLNGLVATTFEDGTLDNSDETLPTSKKVKQYVDNKVSEATPTKGVDYFTEAEIQGIKNDIESNINEDMSTTINTAVTNGESAIDTYIANKEASANTSINNLASQKLDAITSASSTALSNISDAKDDALDSLDDALAEAESDFNSNASSKTSTFNTNVTNRTTIYNDNASSKLSEYNTNSENKTTSFNDNYDEKLSAFNTNATNKTNAFDTNANNKTNTFDTVADRKITILQNLIAAIPDDFGAFRFSVVQSLPETGLSMTLYLVPIGTNNDNQNVYEEYIWLEDESRYEVLGTVRSSADIDLSQYATISDIANVVRKTDYATNEQPGILKVGYSAELTQNGQLNAKARTYQEYQTLGDNHFISKKTLDNVLNGKGYDNDITSLKADRDALVDLTTGNTTISAEGKSITIDKRILSLKNFELLGDTYQKTLTGKNIFPSNYTISQGYLGDNGSIVSSNNSVTISTYIKVKPNETYTLSFNITKGEYRGISYYDTNKTFILRDANNITFTTPSNCEYIRIYFYNSDGLSADEFNSKITNIQLEQGQSATDYEPYVGGVPSPNPNYPQDIDVVTGSQTIKILGKNLIKFPNVNSYGGVTVTINEDGSITASGLPNNNYQVYKQVDITDLLEDGQTYTLSQSIATSKFYIQVNEDNKITYVNNHRYHLSSMKKVSFTVNKSLYKYTCVIQNGNASDWGNTSQSITQYFQLEKGDTATTFDKYKEMITSISLGTIELCKLGDYQDKIYKQNGKWYLYKELGKIILDGSENWKASVDATRMAYRFDIPFIFKKEGNYTQSATYNIISNYFKSVPFNYIYSGLEEGIAYWWNNNESYLVIGITGIETKEDVKQWLSEHNTLVYYVLETPTITEITDTSLISQLEAIELINGVNNIYSVSSNLNAYMKIDAYANVIDILENKADKSELDSKQDKLTAGTNITIASDGTISATGGSTFSGDYNDLTNKPTIFSGSYDDLSNKPTIPDKLKDLADDSTHRLVTDTEKQTWNNKSSFSGNYNDLSNKPTLFSGSYSDLSNKPTIPTVPDIVDNLTTNDATKTLSAKQGKILKDALDDKANADEVIQEQSPFYGASTYLTAAEVIDLIHANKMNIMIYGNITPLLDRSEGN